MNITAAEAPGLPTWVRLAIAIVALTHAMLCLRVLVTRAWSSLVRRIPRDIERVPSAAMLAYGIITGHIARVTLIRMPDEPSLQAASAVTYGVALVAGTIAFAQIVYITTRTPTDT